METTRKYFFFNSTRKKSKDRIDGPREHELSITVGVQSHGLSMDIPLFMVCSLLLMIFFFFFCLQVSGLQKHSHQCQEKVPKNFFRNKQLPASLGASVHTEGQTGPPGCGFARENREAVETSHSSPEWEILVRGGQGVVVRRMGPTERTPVNLAAPSASCLAVHILLFSRAFLHLPRTVLTKRHHGAEAESMGFGGRWTSVYG